MSELKDLEVQEVSVVDEGANPGAKIVLAKRANASVESAIERVTKRLEERIEAIEDAELRKIAARYELLGEKTEDTFKLLKNLRGSAEYERILKVYDKALEQVERAGTFEEVGKSGVGTSSSFEKRAAEYKKSGLSDRWARDAAYVEMGGELE